MAADPITTFFLIFSGAAVLATLALYTRQPLLIAYIAIGALLGPHGIRWVNDPGLVAGIAEIGIIFLLFLLGLDMQPASLLRALRSTVLVGAASTVIFAAAGASVAWVAGMTPAESAVVGITLAFSSTIIGIKLLPTTALHHRHIGELVVSLLLFQDLLAIVVLLILGGAAQGSERPLWLPAVALPLIAGGAYLFVRYVLLRVMARFDVFREFLFLVAIGWCLGLAELARAVGLSHEMGAFIAGVSIATSPISQFIAESLRPLRDFFLVLFFFSVGADFAFGSVADVWMPTLACIGLVLAGKPLIYRMLLRSQGETRNMGWEVGFQLGQTSEFSLLIAYLAASTALIGTGAATLIQATAIATFVLSSYLVVFRYPTPIAVSERLRRD